MCLSILGVLLPVILACMGLCIDVGVLAVSRAQLKTVADGAVLAGANQLNDPQRLASSFNLGNDMSKARDKAQAIGQANSVLGVKAVLTSNAANDPAGDIVIGYKDLTVKNAPLVTDPLQQAMFNSVRVVAHRDGAHGGNVPAFFSKALGFGDTSMAVTSTASVQNYKIKGYDSTKINGSSSLWPIALSLTTYNAMLAGNTTDKFTYNKNNASKVSGGADGIYESSLYPIGTGAGNWGTVKAGVSNNSTSTLASQIQYGVTAAQIAAAGNLTLNPTTTLPGNPGVSLGIKSAILARVGDVVVVPIYDPARSSGVGNNYTYTIVAFQPVVVLNATYNGVHSMVTVQPALTTDSALVAGTAQSSWTAGGVVRLRLTE